MKVFIAGIDGYLGWSLALYLLARGHEVGGVDNMLRRRAVSEMESVSAIPISSIDARLKAAKERFSKKIFFEKGDIRNYKFVASVIKRFKPDAIVHFAEIPSAPYSMIDVMHTTFTQENNITGTLNILYAMRDIVPNAHLIKLGTMGEYGTPNIDIPEGFFEIEYRGRHDTLPFPRQAGSWYHWSKVHDSGNIMFACKIWNLRSTDIMQGVVFGTQVPEMKGDKRLNTRLDFDESFGTAINRFACMAAIAHPLTLFGAGHQKRGFLPLRDSMQCLTIALENPPKKAEYRVFNQFEEVYNLTELAKKVRRVGKKLGLDVTIHNYENPRAEAERHYYNPDHQHLLDLGYKPTHNMEAELEIMLTDLMKYKDRIKKKKKVLVPKIRWSGEKRKSTVIMH